MFTTIVAASFLLSVASTAPAPTPHDANDPSPFVPNPIGIPQGVVNASFTGYEDCGARVSCGPTYAAKSGLGYAAINKMQWATGDPTKGTKTACGGCWHIQPQRNTNPAPGKKLGLPMVVQVLAHFITPDLVSKGSDLLQINNECTDGGTCDQSPENPLNTLDKFHTQLHFDLCGDTGTWQRFFGEVEKGQLIGVAQYSPNCAGLHDGQYGLTQGNVV